MATDTVFVKLDLDPNKHPLFSGCDNPDEQLKMFNSTIEELSVCHKHDLRLGIVNTLFKSY